MLKIRFIEPFCLLLMTFNSLLGLTKWLWINVEHIEKKSGSTASWDSGKPIAYIKLVPFAPVFPFKILKYGAFYSYEEIPTFIGTKGCPVKVHPKTFKVPLKPKLG